MNVDVQALRAAVGETVGEWWAYYKRSMRVTDLPPEAQESARLVFFAGVAIALSKYGDVLVKAPTPERFAQVEGWHAELSAAFDEAVRLQEADPDVAAKPASAEVPVNDTLFAGAHVAPPCEWGNSHATCCARAGEYNGFGTGPHRFECPVKCGCHD